MRNVLGVLIAAAVGVHCAAPTDEVESPELIAIAETPDAPAEAVVEEATSEPKFARSEEVVRGPPATRTG